MEQRLDSEFECGPLEYEIDDFDAVFTEWGYMHAYPKCGDDSGASKNTSSFNADSCDARLPRNARMRSLRTQRRTSPRLPPLDALSVEQERLVGGTAEVQLANDHRGGCCTD